MFENIYKQLLLEILFNDVIRFNERIFFLNIKYKNCFPPYNIFVAKVISQAYMYMLSIIFFKKKIRRWFENFFQNFMTLARYFVDKYMREKF